ncbi:hypothetical protein [Mycoplasma buteonis]|uniref:hypothetical protein n=1 Tax=Mycoplasma buteonis TaxID=171280 RepID=UPI00055A107B|nr:hypothetical protein [Mycoplasma buteonis]
MSKSNTALFVQKILMEKENNFNNLKIEPNTKTQFERNGANIQVTQLATNLPTFKLKNKTELMQFLKNNRFLEKIQMLEFNLYTKGIYALGIENNKKIVLAEVLSYEEDENNKLVYLKVVTKTATLEGESYDLIEEYDLLNSVIIKQYLRSHKTGVTEDFANFKNHYRQKLNDLDYIPYVLFRNRADQMRDIDLVNEEYWKILNTKLKAFVFDTFLSLPLPTINWNLGGDKPKEILKAFYSLDSNRLVKIDTMSALNSMGDSFEIRQTSTQSQVLLQSIESIQYWIKKSLFFKKDSEDGGTHNKHTAEVQKMNSDFEDYIETKANLREYYYEDFARLILRALNLDYKQDISVIVSGSTLWMEEQARIEQTNQDGVNINPTKQIKQAEQKQEYE